MSELREVLVTAQLSQQGTKQLEAALAPAVVYWCRPEDTQMIARVADRVDAAIVAGEVDERVRSGKKIKWIHCMQAGAEKCASPEIFQRGVVLTCSAGRSAQALAEHVLALMLALTYDMHLLIDSQKEHRWCAPEFGKRRAMTGRTVGIIGMGNTGKALVNAVKPFGMRVLCWRRSASPQPGVDRVYCLEQGDSLEELLGQCDYVVLCCTLSDVTWHLMNAQRLRAMRRDAFLVNIGRGDLVEEEALVAALREGVIAGAGLDTFAVEPLPPDSPLWDMSNVVITPHATPSAGNTEAKALSYVLHNIHSFRNDSEYVNRLTAADVYTHLENSDA